MESSQVSADMADGQELELSEWKILTAEEIEEAEEADYVILTPEEVKEADVAVRVANLLAAFSSKSPT